MTPRQKRAMYHTNDVTDMPQHDDASLEKTEGPVPWGFGIKNEFNTHNGEASTDGWKEEAPTVEKQWWDSEGPRYPVTLSHNDVIEQAWDKYYLDNNIPDPRKQVNATEPADGKQAAAQGAEALSQGQQTFSTPEVQEALQQADLE